MGEEEGAGRWRGRKRRRKRRSRRRGEEGRKIIKVVLIYVEKRYQVKIHTVQVFVLVARLLGSVMRATTFLWKPSLVR